MNKSNQQIKDYLKNYCQLEISPKFSVLLTGPWGSGKTWFIDKLRKELTLEGCKFIYVSLYGISTTLEIDEEIFKQLHPKLSSKGMVLAGKVLKGALKGVLKIDLDENKKHESASLNVSIPDIDLPSFLTNIDKHILIFDDIERCTLSINDLLGYINYFVEHGEHKVLLIANEKEIIPGDLVKEKESAKLRYEKIKEKLIGKTFELQPEPAEAIQTFINEMPHEAAKKFLRSKIALIEDIYTLSKYNNLRNLRKCMLDFCDLYKNLLPTFQKESQIVEMLLVELLALTMEVRSGSISIEKVRSLTSDLSIARHTKRGESEFKDLVEIDEKYGNITWRTQLLPDYLWADLFETGLLDYESINKEIEGSIYFKKDMVPAWRKLWNFYWLDDTELLPLVDELDVKFAKKEINNIGELRHSVGILLALSQLKIYKKTKKEILATGKATVQEIKSKYGLDLDRDLTESLDSGYWNGLGFHSANIAEFKKLTEYITQESKIFTDNSLPLKAKSLLKLLPKMASEFTSTLVISRDGDSKYYNIPILKFLDPRDFVKTLSKCDAKSLKILNDCFKQRYRPLNGDLALLLPESDWIKKILGILKEEVLSLKGSIKSEQLKTIQDTLQVGQKTLAQIKKTQGPKP